MRTLRAKGFGLKRANRSSIRSGGVAVASLTRWVAARDAVLAGNSSTIIVIGAGDSTYAGIGATVPKAQNNLAAKLAAALTTAGLPAVVSFASGQDDNRMAATGGWTSFNVGSIIIPYSSASAIGKLSFTPTFAVDTFDVYYLNNSANCTSVDVDGGATIGSISATGGTAFGKFTVQCALGTHTLNLNTVAADGNFLVLGIDGYDSGAKQVRIFNGGIAGTASADGVAAGTWNVPAAIAALNPSLVLNGYGINDWQGGITTTAYQTNQTAFLTAVNGSYDVLFTGAGETDPATTTALVQQNYRDIVAALAAADPAKRAYVSFKTALGGSYAAASGAGYMSDGAHPTSLGYATEAAALVTPLTAGATFPAITKLNTLSLNSATAVNGVAKTFLIRGATTGSTLSVATGAIPTGMTLNSAARTITGTPTVTATANFTLRETLAGATGSPKDTALSIVVSAAPAEIPWTTAAVANDKSSDMTVSGTGNIIATHNSSGTYNGVRLSAEPASALTQLEAEVLVADSGSMYFGVPGDTTSMSGDWSSPWVGFQNHGMGFRHDASGLEGFIFSDSSANVSSTIGTLVIGGAHPDRIRFRLNQTASQITASLVRWNSGTSAWVLTGLQTIGVTLSSWKPALVAGNGGSLKIYTLAADMVSPIDGGYSAYAGG